MEMGKLYDELFKKANIENDKYKITGDDLDNRFILRFSGAAGLAATRVNLARKTLRDESGKWLELSVETPSGSKTRAFINPDKNPKMVKTERDTKRLGGILKDSYPNIKWHLNTYDGEISKVWTPMVKVEAQPGDTESILRWNLAALAETDIDKREIVGKFSQSARNRAQVQWGLPRNSNTVGSRSNQDDLAYDVELPGSSTSSPVSASIQSRFCPWCVQEG